MRRGVGVTRTWDKARRGSKMIVSGMGEKQGSAACLSQDTG